MSLEAVLEGLNSEFELAFAAGAEIRNRRWSSLPVGKWCSQSGVQYHWLAPESSRVSFLRETLNEDSWDLVMLNSFFDREFSVPLLWMRRLGLLPKVPVVLSPRGEFAPGALSLKPLRKQAYLQAVRAFRLVEDVWFHATAEHEHRHIAAQGFSCAGILDAPDTVMLSPPPPHLEGAPRAARSAVHLVFLGRITPVKNIDFAIRCLASVETPVVFDIFGPRQDEAYWNKCEAQIASLPDHVKVRYRGAIEHDKVADILCDYDLFFMPSLGENFSHSIHEALSVGLPVLISDRTPWRGLVEKRAGWDLPLGDPVPFAEAITSYAQTTGAARQALARSARCYVEQRHAENDSMKRTSEMFRIAIG